MSLKYALLGLLSEKPKYGYEIKQQFEGALGNVWSVSYGQLYPTLRRLSEVGWVTKKTAPGKKAAEKNIYSITEKGKKRLDDWRGKGIDVTELEGLLEEKKYDDFKKRSIEILKEAYQAKKGAGKDSASDKKKTPAKKKPDAETDQGADEPEHAEESHRDLDGVAKSLAGLPQQPGVEPDERPAVEHQRPPQIAGGADR